MINLLIARHGNTFDPGDVIRRVGRGTDLPLSISGQNQAKLLGEYLKQCYPDISAVYTSNLLRTYQTAMIVLDVMQLNLPILQTDIFDEIDYGPDEGKPEKEVIERIGEDALKNWEQHNIVPEGWLVNPDDITANWLTFAQAVQEQFHDQTVLVITSNGVARFAPQHPVKLSTGSVSLLTVKQDHWTLEFANRRPIEELCHVEI